MMSTSRLVLDTVAPLLVPVGFKQRKTGIFTIQLSSEVLGWLGLNTATKHHPPGEVTINPVVGARHQEVERLVAELRGERFHAYLPPTISRALGHLIPEVRFKSWIANPEHASVVGADMVAAIGEYGLAFMKSLTTLEELRRALEPPVRFFTEDQARYRRPAVWLLSGEPGRAAEELDKSLAAIGDRSAPADVEFRRFAAALQVRLSS